ncbi:asparaginyl-tRNA synthetase [Entophlyctis sp. JEL0112]|nr:asparaginyl-tRNA synthetase [Entophlyctis sp. JEL0112]
MPSLGDVYLFPVRTVSQILRGYSEGLISSHVTVNGWVRTVRLQKQLAFAVVSDGSTPQGIQAVFSDPELAKGLSTGASVRLEGELVKSIGSAQSTELKVAKVTHLGSSDAEKYPLHKAKLPLEHLRNNMHLRTRTRTFAAMWKVRSAVFQGFHDFMKAQEFTHVTTPVLTSNDCEGAGEAFRVVTPDAIEKNLSARESRSQFDHEFFSAPTSLTVSAQLHLEALCAGLPRVYTMSPNFRAEHSLSTRHLAEFWMLEAEASFVDNLDTVMDLIEASIRDVTTAVVNSCEEELLTIRNALAATKKESESSSRWKIEDTVKMLSRGAPPFHRVTYTDALQILRRASLSGVKTWEHPVDEWGCALQSEHERYLAEEHFKGPVFVTDYPSSIKPFYMLESRMDPKSTDRGIHQGDTVACVDLLVPGIGEVVGGSLREHRYDSVSSQITQRGLSSEQLEWYLDLRRFGSVPHGGYGLGIERYLMGITGMSNVKDVMPMPRWYGNCQF